MTKHYALSAAKRERAGKGVARALRRESRVPAVIYGDKKEPVTISLPSKETTMEYHKGHMFTTLCDLDVDGAKHQVLVRDVQTHPVTDRIEHIDFMRVNEKTKIRVWVPVHFQNVEECKAISTEKGVLNIVRHEVEVFCLAKNIPDEIPVDLTKFEIGDSIKISAAAMPEGATPTITGRDFTLANIAAPKAFVEEETAAPAEGEAAAEGEAKAEGEGEKAEAKKD